MIKFLKEEWGGIIVFILIVLPATLIVPIALWKTLFELLK